MMQSKSKVFHVSMAVSLAVSEGLNNEMKLAGPE